MWRAQWTGRVLLVIRFRVVEEKAERSMGLYRYDTCRQDRYLGMIMRYRRAHVTVLA